MTAAPKTPGRVERAPRHAPLPGLDVAGGLVQGKPSPPAAKVIGLDLSLRSTGLSDGHTWVDRIQPKSTGVARQRVIRETVRTYVHGATLVVIEGLAFRAHDPGLERAGLWWMLRERLDAWGVPVAVAPPAAVKKYATGVGNADKDRVLAAVIRRWPDVDVSGNDEADALVLAALGRDWLGLGSPVPEAHRAAVHSVLWPERVAS